MGPDRAPVVFANVVLHQASDSAITKVEYTDDAGIFRLRNIAPGDYWLEISYVGIETYQSEPFTLSGTTDKDFGTINLRAMANELEEVTVSAQRNMVEVHPDKTVFNVDASPTAIGNDAFELLRKAPGVIIDNNNNIMLAGKSGVRIFIDGKPSPLTANDLAGFLQSLQATDVESIEIITNPSARYEAEGNAGIINIKLKKNENFGTNGSTDLGYTISTYAKYNANLSLNHRNANINLYGRAGYSTGNNLQNMAFLREQARFIFAQDIHRVDNYENYNFRLGADYYIGEKGVLGALVTGYFSDRSDNGQGITDITNVQTGLQESTLIGGSEIDMTRDNINANINYRWEGENGRNLNLDADFARFRIGNVSFQPNRYYTPDGETLLDENIFGNDAPTDIDLYSLKGDYGMPLAEGKLEFGFKVSYVVTDNVFDFFNFNDGNAILDPDRSNQFEYEENINALYAQYNRKLSEAVSIQAGLRMEHTHSLGDLTSTQQVDGDRVERDYVDFFPSAGITWQKNPKNSFRLTYSYRIDRPRYQNLNPFEFKLDELTFQRGNPFLRPQYSHNVEFGHTLNSRFNTSIGFTQTNDLMTEITDTLSDNRAFLNTRNLATQRVVSLNFSAPFSIAQWWNVYGNATLFRTMNEGVFQEGKSVDLSRTTFSGYMQSTFNLPKGLTGEISGFYNSPGIWGGNFRMDAMYAINTGLSMKVLGGSGTLKLALNDIFFTQVWHGVSQFGGLNMDVRGNWESRRFSANFNYNFGNQKVKTNRRKSGLEEESKRVE